LFNPYDGAVILDRCLPTFQEGISMTATRAKNILWDLSDLFASDKDPRIDGTLNRDESASGIVREPLSSSHGSTGNLQPEQILKALKELEAIYEALGRVGTYASLLYAAIPRIRSIRTWSKESNNALLKSETCCCF
jgi:oligoendopeptidase F